MVICKRKLKNKQLKLNLSKDYLSSGLLRDYNATEIANFGVQLNAFAEKAIEGKVLLGDGMSAQVYKLSTKTRVLAVKIVPYKNTLDGSIQNEFYIGRKLTEKLTPQRFGFPRPIYWGYGDFYRSDGDIVPVEIIVMEYIHGCTLKSLGTVNAITPLHLDVEKYITNLTDAVNWMNTETGVLHRDMHLKNIMVDFYTHKPVIIDFGRAILQSEISKDVNPYEFFDQRTYIVRHHKSDSQALQEAINYLRFFKKIIR